MTKFKRIKQKLAQTRRNPRNRIPVLNDRTERDFAERAIRMF